jgi:hypothetical protein
MRARSTAWASQTPDATSNRKAVSESGRGCSIIPVAVSPLSQSIGLYVMVVAWIGK